MNEISGKRHILVFKTLQGDLTVGTDDIGELSAQSWFRTFLNIAPEVARVVQTSVQESALAQRYAMEKRAEDLAAKEAELRVYEAQLRESAQRIQRARDQPAAPAAQSVAPIAQSSRVPQTNYFAITPDKMKTEMWQDMSNEQQQEWMRHFGIKG